MTNKEMADALYCAALVLDDKIVKRKFDTGVGLATVGGEYKVIPYYDVQYAVGSMFTEMNRRCKAEKEEQKTSEI